MTEGGEVTFDEKTTAVNLMVVGANLHAVLSERIFTEEELAAIAAQEAQQAAFVEMMQRMQESGPGQPTFDDGDLDFDDDDE